MDIKQLKFLIALDETRHFGQAAARCHITQPTLSHHMKTLCDCGLVEVRREGKWSHYSLNCETLAAFQAFIGKLSCDKKNGECECK